MFSSPFLAAAFWGGVSGLTSRDEMSWSMSIVSRAAFFLSSVGGIVAIYSIGAQYFLIGVVG